jgi:hypothetical protein
MIENQFGFFFSCPFYQFSCGVTQGLFVFPSLPLGLNKELHFTKFIENSNMCKLEFGVRLHFAVIYLEPQYPQSDLDESYPGKNIWTKM